MDIVSLPTEQIRELFKTRHVLLIGDSIMRSLFVDLVYVLSDSCRLLYSNELTFNRHTKHHQGNFCEKIVESSFNCINSILSGDWP